MRTHAHTSTRTKPANKHGVLFCFRKENCVLHGLSANFQISPLDGNENLNEKRGLGAPCLAINRTRSPQDTKLPVIPPLPGRSGISWRLGHLEGGVPSSLLRLCSFMWDLESLKCLWNRLEGLLKHGPTGHG